MSRNNDYTTGNLLDYLLSRKANFSIPQQINFVEKLEKYHVATMFLLLISNKKLF